MEMLHALIDNFQSCSYARLLEMVEKYDYVSFDIFDTLLKRDVPRPTDVFKVIEEEYPVPNFYNKRISAEKTARLKTPSSEVTLSEIYEDLDIPEEIKDKIKELEIQTEIGLSVQNKDVVPIYQKCLRNNKIILISDMYLDKSIIETLLSKNGYMGYERLYLSNEIRRTKISGELYKYVLKDLNISGSKILHIGNSFKADYIRAKKEHITAVKIATYRNRMHREYRNMLSADVLRLSSLQSFINNRVEGNKYYSFGYEAFGPLLFGFIDWLYNEAKTNGIKQILFLSRDGYIMKKLYDLLGYSTDIPSVYFEGSRRSFRVPSYKSTQSFQEIVESLTVPNMTDIYQVFDSFGLNADDYVSTIKKHGISMAAQLKRITLIENRAFRKLFEEVKNDIFKVAERERAGFISYIKQFNFSLPTAIVDIGWSGSMQMYLEECLSQLGIAHNFCGCYVGLVLKSRDNLGSNGYHAKGYTFDCLNNNDKEMTSPFIGLIETLFLEQAGSVKNYSVNGNTTLANRYEYEYLIDGQVQFEAINVNQVQEGALQFAEDMKKSCLRNYVNQSANIMFNNLYSIGVAPTDTDISMFGQFRFFNCGTEVCLAKPASLLKYLLDPNKLKKDLFESQWKIGFLKALLHVGLPYEKIFTILRREANK